MKIEKALLEKLQNANIEIEEKEREVFNDDDIAEIVKTTVLKIPCARDYKYLQISDRITSNLYIESDFEKFKFIEDYEAIWSSELNVVECAIEYTSRLAPSSSIYLIRQLARCLNEDTDKITDLTRYTFETSTDSYTITLGGASLEYSILSTLKDRRPSFESTRRIATLRIENIYVSTHDQAKKILEKIGNSILFKLDITCGLDRKLVEDRDIRRASIRRERPDYEIDKKLPLYEYDSEPMSLYWYAKSANGMPLLQFLAFYQILEFYFPVFSHKEALLQIQNMIKDPRFNPNKDTDITKIINIVNQNKNQIGYGSELDQLKSTLKNCITSDELKNYILDNEGINSFMKDKKAKKIASKSLNILNQNTDIVAECAERLYEIRCRVVHTKTSEKNEGLLLPSSPELKHLVYDIAILDMIAKKVLIATSKTLRI